MLVQRAYKTELKLNNRERTLLAGCAGAARFAYNWGLTRKSMPTPPQGRVHPTMSCIGS